MHNIPTSSPRQGPTVNRTGRTPAHCPGVTAPTGLEGPVRRHSLESGALPERGSKDGSGFDLKGFAHQDVHHPIWQMYVVPVGQGGDECGVLGRQVEGL